MDEAKDKDYLSRATEGESLFSPAPLAVTRAMIESNLYVHLVLGRAFFEQMLKNYGRDAWNAYSDRLRVNDLQAMFSSSNPTTVTDTCQPICVEINLAGEDFRGADLANMDLQIPIWTGADFRDADLRNARLGDMQDCNFAGADLRGMSTEGGIVSGASFTGASLDGVTFRDCRHEARNPPVGLQLEHMNQFRRFPVHWGSDADSAARHGPRYAVRAETCELRSFWEGG